MKRFLFALLFLFFPLASLNLNYPSISLALDYQFVNETSWKVGSYENGVKSEAEPVPWVFRSNKTVNAGNLWRGIWKEEIGNRINVVIPSQDEFEVNFLNANEFIVFKNGEPYRWGRRQ
ncbi:hypothetical protein PseudUWO311_13830 [Pseudanabaena sp. UWO311]|uniref:hypothetical protein n=1 Tax=Pseudanabaena sp. UWO311 TaxID=2487337 RepID=UPI00115AC97D|nr:hypothetical protein [Pseudanabaena sp. UWO311]TYQ26016.1 hypothetical protein PseudUWO311_13830 [Pseudanabaena sp. UWO311]